MNFFSLGFSFWGALPWSRRKDEINKKHGPNAIWPWCFVFLTSSAENIWIKPTAGVWLGWSSAGKVDGPVQGLHRVWRHVQQVGREELVPTTICVQYHIVAQPLPTVVCLYPVTKSRETEVFCVLSYVSSWQSDSFPPSTVYSRCHEVKGIIDCSKKWRNLKIHEKLRSGYTAANLWFEICGKRCPTG